MQFRFGKLVLEIKVGIYGIFFLFPGLSVCMGPYDLCVLDIIPGVNQVCDIAFYRGAVDFESVFVPKLFRNLLLRHGVVSIRIPAQDLQDIQDNNLLSAFHRHVRLSPFLFLE